MWEELGSDEWAAAMMFASASGSCWVRAVWTGGVAGFVRARAPRPAGREVLLRVREWGVLVDRERLDH